MAIGIICGLAAAAIWGGGAVVSRHLITSSLDPAELTILRYAGCFPVALATLIWMGKRIRLALGWPRLAVLLLLGGPLYHALVVAGYRHASAGGGALLLSGLLPVIAFCLSYGLSGTMPSRAAAAGLAAIVAGLALFNGGGLSVPSVSVTGIVIFTAAAAAWALLNECVRRWRVDPIRLTIALAVFSPLFLPLYLLAGPPPDLASYSGEVLLQIAYHGWFAAIGATALFFTSVRLAGAHLAAILQTLAPGFAVGFGAAILGEPLIVAQAAGLMLVTVGLLLAISGSVGASPAGERLAGTSWGRNVVIGLAPRLKLSRWS